MPDEQRSPEKLADHFILAGSKYWGSNPGPLRRFKERPRHDRACRTNGFESAATWNNLDMAKDSSANIQRRLL